MESHETLQACQELTTSAMGAAAASIQTAGVEKILPSLQQPAQSIQKPACIWQARQEGFDGEKSRALLREVRCTNKHIVLQWKAVAAASDKAEEMMSTAKQLCSITAGFQPPK